MIPKNSPTPAAAPPDIETTTTPSSSSLNATMTSHRQPTSTSSSSFNPKPTTTTQSSRLTVPSGNDHHHQRHHHHYHPSSSSSTPFLNPTTSITITHYLTRMLDIQSLDIQSALDQMRTLCTLQPGRVYKTSYYRKQTKDHWARDDPAFAVLQIVFLCISSLAYCVAFRSDRIVSDTFRFGFRSVCWNWGVCGLLMASLGRGISNGYLVGLDGNVGGGVSSSSSGGKKSSSSSSSTGSATVGVNSHHVRQRVEWLYAWDIHCNSFFPLFVLLYGVQFFLLPLVLGGGWLNLIVANALYGMAFSWYFYVTHLGYRALPFLTNTEVFLFPIAAVWFIFLLNVVGYPFGFGWNASRIMAYFYFNE